MFDTCVGGYEPPGVGQHPAPDALLEVAFVHADQTHLIGHSTVKFRSH